MLRILVGIFMVMLMCGSVFADGSMWPLFDLEKLPFDSMYQIGLELKPDQIYHPDKASLSDAIASFSGGSATFVSDQGLMVTNHHVVFGSLQRHSTVENNYIYNGYYADTRDKELPALGINVQVTLSVDDVTAKILEGINEATPDSVRSELVEQRQKEIINEAEKDRDVYCNISEFYGGRQYMLYTYFRIKDVRLVYVPSDYIGNYGGETDNWMWPRHAGDFGFVRAYVGPDGSSAEYSEDNVPYKPKKFLPISREGVHEGDFTMMMGYPGQTSRFISYSHLKYLHDYYYPYYLDFSERRLALTEKIMAENPNYAVRLASTWSGFSNFYKKARGIMKGFKKADVLVKKEALENKLLLFIKDNNLSDKYGTIFPQLDSLFQSQVKDFKHDYLISTFQYSSDYTSMANRIVKWVTEQQKEDSEREQGYQERDRINQIRYMKRAQPNLLPAYEKGMINLLISEVLKYDGEQTIQSIKEQFSGYDSIGLQNKIDEMVDNTVIGDLDQRLTMLEMSLEELAGLDDPMINLALAMREEFDENRKKAKIFDAALNKLEPQLINAYLEFQPESIFPDANGTKRFNFGQVGGYSPDDGVLYKYYTTFSGMIAKETDVDPFVVPEQIKNVYLSGDYGIYYDSLLGDVPVDMLVNNSGTNGSSGSSVLNGKGELVGLDFDTNFDGVIADYWYDPTFCRSISVTSRYMLFLMDKVYHLDNLLNELTIH